MGARSRSWATTRRSRPAPGAPGPSRRSCASRRPPAGSACRCCTWSTRPGRGSLTRSTCSPAAATRDASSSTRCSSRAGCRRSASSSALRRPAARTSRRSATWSSWSRGTRRCTWAPRAWWRSWSASASTSRSSAAPACTARRAAAATSWSRTTARPSRRLARTSPTSRRTTRRRLRPPRPGGKPIAELVPVEAQRGYDMRRVIDALVDEGSWLEVKKLFARELLTGFARLDGRAVGILANQPMQKGGVLFIDSSDKAVRFIWLCDAFNIPLLFLADVPGFMIGTQVERRGIIRHGAKMITAVAEATVPKISVIVRKAYGAGLYAMAGPAFDSDCVLALPSAQIAVMGPEPAINAVFYNRLAGLPPNERERMRQELEEEYRQDVDLYKLASNLIVDDVVEPERLRDQLVARFNAYATRTQAPPDRKHGVPPV